MTSDTTTLARANSARGEWQNFAAFLRKPALPERAVGLTGAALAGTLRMLALDIVVMMGLVAIAGTVLMLGFELPENQINTLEWTGGVIALVVLGAPLMEEIFFRGWLSGRPGHVLAFVLVLAGFFTAGSFARPAVEVSQTILPLGAGFICILLGGVAMWTLRARGPMRWFAAGFPFLYLVSTVGFALVHLLNYTEGTLPVLLPLVVPQLVVGAILGYVRVTYGLWASVLLHALHNGIAVGAVLLALQLGL